MAAVGSVDPANSEQARAWDGDEGAFWAANADQYDAAIQGYQPLLLDAAGIGAGDRVLDIGCGTGQTTRDAARLAAEGRALGVDLSGPMLAVARERAERDGLSNVEFVQADAQVHAFAPASYDVVVSRAGAMFFADLTAAFANIARAVTPGGRMALLVWQPLPTQEWILSFLAAFAAGRPLPPPPPDAPGPFALGDPDRVHSLLASTGWTDASVDGITRDMSFGTSVDDAHRLVSGQLGWMLSGLDDEQRAGALEALRESMQTHLTSEGVVYGSAAWLVTARRS